MPDIFRLVMVLKDVTKINTPESYNGNGSIKEMEEAFLAVLKRSEPLLQKVAWMFFKRKEDREELIQEVIYRLWSALPNFRNEADAQTWLSSIAFQTAANWSRDAKRYNDHKSGIFPRLFCSYDF
jgi:DNA-directed RNA polymerase specialized sigma24 family protein